jgi:hypothetical protein
MRQDAAEGGSHRVNDDGKRCNDRGPWAVGRGSWVGWNLETHRAYVRRSTGPYLIGVKILPTYLDYTKEPNAKRLRPIQTVTSTSTSLGKRTPN